MTYRRKLSKKKEEERRKAEELVRTTRRKRTKKIVGITVGILLLFALVYVAVQTAPPTDWVECYDGTLPLQQHTHFWLYIQIGDKVGALNVSFIRIPENLGVSNYCGWPMHTHSGPGERTLEFTKIHIEAPNTHAYTLGDFFAGWSEWMSYPRSIYFSADGVSYYRTSNFEMLVGKSADEGTMQRVYSYGAYVPQDGDFIRLVVHSPYDTVPGPYPGGDYPITADFTYVRVSGMTYAFMATANGTKPPFTFSWDFDDGTTGTGQTVTHTFSVSSAYIVELRVTDASGTVVSVRHGLSA